MKKLSTSTIKAQLAKSGVSVDYITGTKKTTDWMQVCGAKYHDKFDPSKTTFFFGKGYFYRHGNTSDGWADTLTKKLTEAGFKGFQILGDYDWYRDWPSTSYFMVVVQFEDETNYLKEE